MKLPFPDFYIDWNRLMAALGEEYVAKSLGESGITFDGKLPPSITVRNNGSAMAVLLPRSI